MISFYGFQSKSGHCCCLETLLELDSFSVAVHQMEGPTLYWIIKTVSVSNSAQLLYWNNQTKEPDLLRVQRVYRAWLSTAVWLEQCISLIFFILLVIENKASNIHPFQLWNKGYGHKIGTTVRWHLYFSCQEFCSLCRLIICATNQIMRYCLYACPTVCCLGTLSFEVTNAQILSDFVFLQNGPVTCSL